MHLELIDQLGLIFGGNMVVTSSTLGRCHVSEKSLNLFDSFVGSLQLKWFEMTSGRAVSSAKTYFLWKV